MTSRTNRIITPLIVFVLVTTAPTFAGNIIYVDVDAAGANNGSSWADAFSRLQVALGGAQAGDEIRVAKGVYIGLYFQLINGVAIRGGYAGLGEPDPNARDVEQFETILKGDPDIDDETNFANYSGTGLHVIIGSWTDWTAILDGFTITGGYSEGEGGGMYNTGGTPTLINCKFIRNFATYGGGAISNVDTEIYPTLGGPTLIHCTFIENSCNKWGGAIYNNEASPILINCTFIGNSAKRGGGIYGDSSPSLTNCKFIGNSAWGYEDDDGIWHDGHGGAIYHACCGNLKLNKCTFIANSGITGGALYFRHEPSPKMSECMFIGNLAQNYGGAIYIQDFLNPNLKQCTFADNSAANGNALAGIPSSRFYGKPNILKITNSILWDGGDEIWNNDDSAIAITYSDVEGSWPGEGNIDADPFFVDPGYWNENRTPQDANDDVWVDGDYHLLTRSPCIDTGDPNYLTEPNETDLDGRPRVIGGRIDMGAYEFPDLGLLFVDDDATGNNNGRSWANAYNYLQDALAVAKSDDEIRVAQGIYKPDQGAGITLGDREATFQLNNGVTLKGGYAGFGEPDSNARDVKLYETILSGDLNGDDGPNFGNIQENSYHVVTGSGTDAMAILNGFTVCGGNADGSSYSDPKSKGAGMYNHSGSPTLANCTFKGNSATAGWWCLGGGMCSESGSPLLTNCTFEQNLAASGGAMYIISGNPVIEGCTFVDNTTDEYGGGALAISGGSPSIINSKFENNHSGSYGGAIGSHSSRSPKFTNCIVTYNSSHRSGGGIFISEGSPILTNCKFSGNSAGGYGGAIHCEETSSPTIRNCLIIGNKAEADGGGISNTDGSDSIIENCTITDNIANDKGGGIYSPDRMTVINSILWGSYPDQITRNYRIVINYSDVEGGWSDVGNFDEDPCFFDEGYWDANGTPQDSTDDFWVDGDYRLLWDSPCIDAGEPDYIPEPNETDLDGKPRVINSRIDMGAYEYGQLVSAEARVVPQTINLASKGKSITCYIWLPDEYDVADIEPNSIFLEDEIQPRQFSTHQQKQVAIAKFSREQAQAILDIGEIELTITGQLIDGTAFEGTDTIKVINKAGK